MSDPFLEALDAYAEDVGTAWDTIRDARRRLRDRIADLDPDAADQQAAAGRVGASRSPWRKGVPGLGATAPGYTPPPTPIRSHDVPTPNLKESWGCPRCDRYFRTKHASQVHQARTGHNKPAPLPTRPVGDVEVPTRLTPGGGGRV